MTSTLTINEYIGLKLSFPLLNTNNLVKIPSRVKTPGVIELMEKNDKRYGFSIFVLQSLAIHFCQRLGEHF